MLALDRIAERRILEAIARGELSGLEGEGRPIELDDDTLVPAELRLTHRILRNSGYLPEPVSLRRDIHALESAPEEDNDRGQRVCARRRLGLLRARLAARGGRESFLLDAGYERRIAEKLGRGGALRAPGYFEPLGVSPPGV